MTEADGADESIVECSSSTTSPPKRQRASWELQWTRIQLLASQAADSEDREQCDDHVSELVACLDQPDQLVGYAAMEALRGVLARTTDKEAAAQYISLIVSQGAANTTPGYHFRLQLLRYAIKSRTSGMSRSTASESGGRSGEDDAGADEDDDEVHKDTPGAMIPGNLLCLGAVSNSWADVERVILGAVRCGDSVVHEALLCLSDTAKRTADERGQGGDPIPHLSATIASACTLIASRDFVSAPSFLTCAMIDLLADWYFHLSLSSMSDEGTAATWRRSPPGLLWWDQVTRLLPPGSTCTNAAIDMFQKTISSDAACSESFIAVRHSRFPFLQKWFQLFCTLVIQALHFPGSLESIWAESDQSARLPSRAQLITVLMEQDDVMIDVLSQLMTISQLLKCHESSRNDLTRYFQSELNVDALFSDLLHTFGDDRLVLLDMLMSSETKFLSYLMQYLRICGDSWPRPREVWHRYHRLDEVMAVLIRLRMEIERLFVAHVFPYNPTPLLRRLMQIEDLYDSADCDCE